MPEPPTMATPVPTSTAYVTTPVTFLEAPEDQAWQAVRGGVGPTVAVLRPTWLPDRFVRTSVLVQYADVTPEGEPRYRVGYRAPNGEIITFALGAVNSSPPTVQEGILLRGLAATFSATDGWPRVQVKWTERGGGYSIQSIGLSRDDLLRVGAGMRPL